MNAPAYLELHIAPQPEIDMLKRLFYFLCDLDLNWMGYGMSMRCGMVWFGMREWKRMKGGRRIVCFNECKQVSLLIAIGSCCITL